MISVIIPVHNEKEHLNTLLPYLLELSETHGNSEIIIAISSRNTEVFDMVPGYSKTLVLECNGAGRALQMNEGVGIAKGDALVFLHADVKPPRSFFKDIHDTLDQGFLAGFFSYKFNSERTMLKFNASFTSRDGFFTGGGDQCLFIKTAMFKKLGGFDNSQVLMEDFEFFKRMKRKKIPYKIVTNDLLVSARKYEHNSYLRVNLTNLLLLLLFRSGVSAKRLKALHDGLLSFPKRRLAESVS